MGIFKKKQRIVTYVTFETFWAKFYFLNPQRSKIRKFEARIHWQNYNCVGVKRKIIEGLEKGISINAYEYLVKHLK